MQTEKQRALYTYSIWAMGTADSPHSAVSFVLHHILFTVRAINFSISLLTHLYVTDDTFYLNNDFQF